VTVEPMGSVAQRDAVLRAQRSTPLRAEAKRSAYSVGVKSDNALRLDIAVVVLARHQHDAASLTWQRKQEMQMISPVCALIPQSGCELAHQVDTKPPNRGLRE